MKTNDAYAKVVQSLKRRKKGATAADICAATALPLAEVRTLLPKAADEYSGHLQISQSGEILYTFSGGFTSRYRGVSAALKRFSYKFVSVFKAASVLFFKIWIMLMLVGYFLLFITIALAALVLSVAAQSRSSGSGGRRGGPVGFNLFGLIWRLWFINEITKPRYPYDRGLTHRPKEKGRPMHKAVFSFVFGEEDPNKDWEDHENKTIIVYIQSNKGVISLPEYMAFSGKNSLKAEEALLSFCMKFGGSPEVTEQGTIVYKFDEIMLHADSKKCGELSPPVKRLKTFSDNKKKMNTWFIIINAVNLIFGSYFFYNSLVHGSLAPELHFENIPYFYAFTHGLLRMFTANPVSIIAVVLGIIPLVFSVLFWLIPALRKYMETKENEEIKLNNFKKFGFVKIWSSPHNVDLSNFSHLAKECQPENLEQAADRVIKEMGAVYNPEVVLAENGQTLYSFAELEREKEALEKYRKDAGMENYKLGDTVFDTEKS